MSFAKIHLSRLCMLGFFLLLFVLFLTPQNMLFFRAATCGMKWSDAPVCVAFFRSDKSIRSGYLISRHNRFGGEHTEHTFNIVTGKLLRMCGDRIYQVLQNGKYCAEGADIEFYKSNNQKILKERQRKIREAQEAYKKGLR